MIAATAPETEPKFLTGVEEGSTNEWRGVMIASRVIALGLVMISGAAAHAQTVISRQISEEPVETTVTQGPYGTVITRRPLDPSYRRVVPPSYVAPSYVAPSYVAPSYVAPGYAAPTYAAPGYAVAPSYAAPVYPAPGYVAPGYAAPVALQESDEDDDEAVETITVRKVREPVVAPRRIVRRAPPILARAVEPAPRLRRAAYRPLVLRPAQREIVYRTIVRERVYASPYAANPFAVGAIVPQTVSLTAVPSTVAVQVPVTRGYQYVVVNNRVLLVDPATSIVVADVTP
jgi:hypothetical protein